MGERRNAVLAALGDMPVVVISGLRQTGKTTFIQHEPALRTRRYLSLDDFAQLAAAERNPEAFVAGDDPVTIDEAQRCPAILTAIKHEVDRSRRPGRFLLSGSANFALLRGVSESLAGRAVYLALHPFSRREITGTVDDAPFLPAFFASGRLPVPAKVKPVAPGEVLRGGIPPVCLGQVRDPSLWFKGYEQTYLERDVRELSRVGDLLAFRHVLALAARRTGQLLRLSELARDAKLNPTTTGRYLRVMETSFVFFRTAPHLANRASRGQGRWPLGRAGPRRDRGLPGRHPPLPGRDPRPHRHRGGQARRPAVGDPHRAIDQLIDSTQRPMPSARM